MIVSFDLTGLFLLIVLPPLLVYLCGNAYELRHHWSNHSFNRIVKINRDLQLEIRDLQIESRDLLIESRVLRKEIKELKDE